MMKAVKPYSRRVLSSRSPATKYEVMLVEDTSLASEKLPNESRMTTCFTVFDEVLPQLGVYRQVMGMLRDELYEAVYSLDYTTIPANKARSPTPIIERVPYFTLVNRIYNDRDENAEVLNEKLSKLEEAIVSKNKDLRECIETVDDLRFSLKERREEINNLNREIQSGKLERLKMQEDMNCEARLHESMKENYEEQLSKLRKQLSDAEETVEFLMGYKEGYNELDEAFKENQNSDEEKLKPVQMIPLTKRAKLIQEIAAAKVLEEQLLAVQNTVIEEYETCIENRNTNLNRVEGLNIRVTSDEMESEWIEEQVKEWQKTEDSYKKNIADIENELQLTKVHCCSLENQLAELDGDETNKEKMAYRKTNQRRKTKFSGAQFESQGRKQSNNEEATENEDIDFVAIMSSQKQNPFIPQEKILNKYAVMLYYSCNQGKNFHEFKDAKFCPSCGETTFICPHKIVEDDKVISLPHNCTNLKITRPAVHIATNGDVTSTPGGMQAEAAVESTLSKNDGDQEHIITSYKYLWDDYFSRSTVTRHCPRLLSKDTVLTLLGQFFATIIRQDEYSLEDEKIVSVLDTLYMFFQDRYLVTNIVYLTMHDFISAVIKFAPNNRVIQLFAQTMCGHLDPASFRYIFIINDFIEHVKWMTVNDIRVFAQVIYPFMGEEDLEQFTMGYISFSENKISRQLVSEYFLYIILKYREPRFQEIEAKLLQQPSRRAGFMTDIEFAEAIDNIFPLASEKHRRRLFIESAEHKVMHSAGSSVSVARLSQITSYLTLVQLSPVIRENVATKVAKRRLSSIESIISAVEKAALNTTDNSFFSLSALKVVGNEKAKFAKAQQLKRIEAYDFD